MKNRLLLICFLFVVLGAAVPMTASASGRGLNFGINAGISPTVWFYNAYRVGAEAGFRFSDRLGLVAEVGFGSTTYKSSAGWQEDSSSSSAKTTYAAMPASLALHFFTPVNSRLAVYLGLGGGYYSLSIKNETEDRSLYYNPQTTAETQKAQAFAPHVCLGLECGLSKKVFMVGEVRQSAGKTKVSTIDRYGFNSEQDISFGGMLVKIGIRVYLGGSDNS